MDPFLFFHCGGAMASDQHHGGNNGKLLTYAVINIICDVALERHTVSDVHYAIFYTELRFPLLFWPH